MVVAHKKEKFNHNPTGETTMGEWKIPGYTGHIPAANATIAKTPMNGQKLAQTLTQESSVLPSGGAAIDAEFSRAFGATPKSRASAFAAYPAKPQQVKGATVMQLGDTRLRQNQTTYGDFTAGARSPAASPLAAFIPEGRHVLKGRDRIANEYKKTMEDMPEAVLKQMVRSLRMRINGNIRSNSNSAFKLRRQVRSHDPEGTGWYELEDLHAALEGFGLQLGYKELVALFCQYDHLCQGGIRYEEALEDLLEPDNFALIR